MTNYIIWLFFFVFSQTIKAQDKSIQVAAIYNWDWIRYMSTKGYPSDLDMELDCRDDYVYDECDVIVADTAAEYLYNMYNTTEKSFTFIYFAYTDVLGHTYGWCGEQYNDGLDVVDAQVIFQDIIFNGGGDQRR